MARGLGRLLTAIAGAGLAGLMVVALSLYAYDAWIGVNQPYRPQAEPHPLYPELGRAWPMHPVDNPGDWLPNGLDAGDVDGDGDDDYLTNYEFRGRLRIALFPGAEAAGKGTFWPAIDVGRIANAENAAFGDLDDDGHLDIVVAHGVEYTRRPAGLAILWGEAGPRWHDAGDLPASRDRGHWLTVRVTDLDGDGDADLVAGGRASRPAGGPRAAAALAGLTWAGLRWFENPGPAAARDLAAWTVHDIDPTTPSGHGFALGDVDGDGDTDIVNGNADWDTPDEAENVVWYEHPGPHALRAPWPGHELYRGSEFIGKEQVVIADLDGDGRQDILIPTPTAIYWFQNRDRPAAAEAIRFVHQVIPKHPAARWPERALQVADLNGDGRNDIVGALIHQDGRLPRERAAVFWMEQTTAGWHTHGIKWGDGFLGLGRFNGEKWDQLLVHDVDGDGDPDLIANCEEYNRLRSIIAVVWFENPLFAAERP